MAALGEVGLRGALSSSVLFWLIALVRGVMFGVFLAAALVAAYAAIAGLTINEQDRVKGFALVQSAYGVGLSQTGALTLPTLVVDPSEHGCVSGLLAATNTLAFTVGPAAAGALYGINGALPYALTAAALAGLLFYLGISSRIRESQSLAQKV